MSDQERAGIYAQIERPPEPDDSAEFAELVEQLTDLKRSGKLRSSFDFNLDSDNPYINLINNNKLSKKSKTISTEKGFTLYSSPKSTQSGDSTGKTTMLDYDPTAADADSLFEKDFYDYEPETKTTEETIINVLKTKSDDKENEKGDKLKRQFSKFNVLSFFLCIL
jgi:hypothetical protein